MSERPEQASFSAEIPDYDLFSSQFKADPFPTFAAMRRDAPIYAHQSPTGSTIWYITRYEDVVSVLKDDVNFVKDYRNTQPRHETPPVQPTLSVHASINRNMLFADPPDHTRLRALVSQAFTPRRVAQMAPRIAALADGLLDAMVSGDNSAELIAAFALPLPLRVIAGMLGIPDSDYSQVSDWSQAIISPGARGLRSRERKRKMQALVAYLQQMFVDRRRHPQDDLVTALVQAEAEGDRLSEAELSSMVALLFVTGHETVVNLIGNGVLALLLHPQQLALLRRRPDLIDSAIEELLRYDGPVETSTMRWVRRDFTFKGHAMQRGDLVRVVITSANRDAAQFAAPDTLNIERSDNRHLQFGTGIHYCLGAPLARLEGRIALPLLFERLPRLRLAVPMAALQWRGGVLFRGLESLSVRWD
ncbi:MAG: cytochrome P450 [Anaerolineae bacterium]|nr:cytochrome P450 [Anaerolineae bacterium]